MQPLSGITAVDTNVLVRLFTKDNPRQWARAVELFSAARVWVSNTVLLEMWWVLRNLYSFDRTHIIGRIEKLAGLENVILENPTVIARTLEWCAAGLEFEDALHLAGSAGADRFATFDQRLARRADKLADIGILTL